MAGFGGRFRLGWVAFACVSASVSVSVSFAIPAEMAARLKYALSVSQRDLGELEPWQKQVFDDEVLPQFSRFIKNYGASQSASSNAKVEVDMNELRNYLRFHRTKVNAAAGGAESGTQIAAVILASKDCEKCESAVPAVKALMNRRLERRGYSPLWLAPSDVHEASGAQALAAASEAPRARGSPGAWVIELKRVPPSELDQAHADEQHFRVASWMSIYRPGRGAVSGMLKPLFHHDGSIEIREAESFEATAGALASDAVASFGAKTDEAFASLGNSQGDSWIGMNEQEKIVALSGFTGFAGYEQARTVLEQKLGLGMQLRMISRGRAEFALASAEGKNQDAEIQNKVAALNSGTELPGGVQAEYRP